MKVAEYLDAAIQKLGLESDYALAKKLGIHNGRLAEYRQGKSRPDAYVWVRLGIILNQDPMAMIAEVEMEREKRPERVEFWRDFLSRAPQMLIVPAMALHFTALLPDDLSTENHGGIDNRTYSSIMRNAILYITARLLALRPIRKMSFSHF